MKKPGVKGLGGGTTGSARMLLCEMTRVQALISEATGMTKGGEKVAKNKEVNNTI